MISNNVVRESFYLDERTTSMSKIKRTTFTLQNRRGIKKAIASMEYCKRQRAMVRSGPFHTKLCNITAAEGWRFVLRSPQRWPLQRLVCRQWLRCVPVLYLFEIVTNQ